MRDRWESQDQKIHLTKTTRTEDIYDKIDGLFHVAGQTLKVQSKTRENKYKDIGVEILRLFRNQDSDFENHPGRDYISSYDLYVCLTWEDGEAFVNIIWGAHQKQIVDALFLEWKLWRADLLTNTGQTRGYLPPFRSSHYPGAEVRHVKDPQDGHPKLIAYIPPSSYLRQYIRRYECSPTELAHIFE